MESKENANQFPLQPQSDDKDKALPSQVLEYYKKYSQNRQLPKYFCGTSSSFKIEDWHEIPSKKFDREHSTVAVNTEEIYEETVKPNTSQDEYWTRSPLIDQDQIIKVPDINVIGTDNICVVTSPTSSVASNRKLEWDNGADIGYSNVESHKILQKSISLPVLTNLEYGELRKNLLILSPEGKFEFPEVLKKSASEQASHIDIISKPSASSFNPPYSSSTSESIKSSNKNYISSSSSSVGPQQKQYFNDSDSSSEIHKALKKKVGLPLAESTPIIQNDQYVETPKLLNPNKGGNNFRITEKDIVNVDVDITLREKLSNSCENLSVPKSEKGLKKWHSQVDLNMVDQVSHYKNLKILKLCVSKPVVVECCGFSNVLIGENKFIQTSLPRNTSIAVQTDFDFTNCQKLSTELKKNVPVQVERQSILYICHSDSDKEKNTNSSGTQTNSAVLSNCNSFEYLYGADYDQNLKKPLLVTEGNNQSPSDQDAAETAVVMDKFLFNNNLRRCPPKSDLTTLTPDSDKTELTTTDSSPKESPLAELISTKPSEHLIDDLQKNLQLLQKIIKSKKYDSITKKYCLKKIVQKLVDAKYSDDSSESFDTNEKSTIKKYVEKENIYVSERSETSSKDTDHTGEKMGLHVNKPWLPAQQSSGNQLINNIELPPPPRNETQMKNLQTQTFINEILPNSKCEQAFVPYQEPNSSKNFVPIQIIQNEKARLERNPLFTLTDHGLLHPNNVNESKKPIDHGDSSNSTENELYEVLQPSVSEGVTPLMTSTTNSSSLNGRKLVQSWREDKTRSEQLLEQKVVITGMGDNNENKDHLINFAKKEREHQLSWINNEITHLSKLKKLLERREIPKNINKTTDVAVQQNIMQRIIDKPRIEDMKDSKKSTTVYVVTTEKSRPHSTCDPKTCKNPRCRERFISPTPTSTSASSRSKKERSSSPKPKIMCKCAVAPCCCKPEPSSSNLKICGTKTNIGNEVIDLQNARLVSSEQFTTGNNENCRTSIRRYTFEIPLEQNSEESENQPQIIECPARSRSRSASPKRKCDPECSSKPSSPKSRLACELVVTDEIVGGGGGAEERSRSVSPQRCKCTKPTTCKCNCKKTQTTDSLLDVKSCICVSSSSSSESEECPSEASTQLCRCCKRKCEKMRRARLESSSTTKTTLCYPCYNQNKINAYCMYPGHVCRCYNAIQQAEAVQKMRKTIRALEDLEEEEAYCKCCKAKSPSGYCAKCNCKLKKKPKGGMAYVLTLESDNEKPKKCKKKSEPVIEEIKIKVVSPTSSNKQRGKLSNACSEDCRGMGDSTTKDNSTNESEYCPKKQKKKKRKSRTSPTLQEYLVKNNPNFVSAAEKRRQCLLDLAYMREQRCQKYKQLLALTNGIPYKNNTATTNTKSQHVFSSKEMKQLTAKHYKKLPEVQQKLIDKKEKQIKKANKLLADIFNQKLRQQVLKGKHTIPPEASIIKLV